MRVALTLVAFAAGGAVLLVAFLVLHQRWLAKLRVKSAGTPPAPGLGSAGDAKQSGGRDPEGSTAPLSDGMGSERTTTEGEDPSGGPVAYNRAGTSAAEPGGLETWPSTEASQSDQCPPTTATAQSCPKPAACFAPGPAGAGVVETSAAEPMAARESSDEADSVAQTALVVEPGNGEPVHTEWEPSATGEEPLVGATQLGGGGQPSAAGLLAPTDQVARGPIEPAEAEKVAEATGGAATEEIRASRTAMEQEEPARAAPSETAAPRDGGTVQPGQYRPQARGMRRGLSAGRARAGALARLAPLPVVLRLRRELGDIWSSSLLFRRPDGAAENLKVSRHGYVLRLELIHDKWYAAQAPKALGALLLRGGRWQADAVEQIDQSWQLSGRPVYVLGRGDVGGFVMLPTLALHGVHVVICEASMARAVEAELAHCCSSIPGQLGERDGLPPGWVGYHPIIPSKPSVASLRGDILDALRPSPKVKIELLGGVRLRYSEWLQGYPPEIRLIGDLANAGQVMVDGKPATVSADGVVTATGAGELGQHLMCCGALSRSYTIVPAIAEWEGWPAHRYQDAGHSNGNAAICGAMVLRANTAGLAVPPVTSGNPCVLGARPGELAYCTVRHDLGLIAWTSLLPFNPIWSVPGHPLSASKARARICLVGPRISPIANGLHRIPRQPTAEVRRWLETILACSQKGLLLEPDDVSSRALWRQYGDVARLLRKVLT